MSAFIQSILASDFGTLALVAFCQSVVTSLFALGIARSCFRRNSHRRAGICAAAIVAVFVLPLLTVGIWHLKQSQNHASMTASTSKVDSPAAMTRGNPVIDVRVLDESIVAMPAAWHRVLPFVAAIWFIGGVGFLGRYALAAFRLKRMLRDTEACTDPSVLAAADTVFDRLGLHRRPRLLMTERAVSPFVVGIRNPAIVLPSRACQLFTSEQLEDVLTHEAAHLRRQDLWIAMVATLTGAVLWLCPWVHLLRREWAQAREEACDCWALGYRNASDYAETLLAVGQLVVTPRQQNYAIAMASHPLPKRIETILDDSVVAPPKQTKGIIKVIVVPILIAIAATSTPLAAVAANTLTNVTPPKTTETVVQTNDARQIRVESKFVEISSKDLNEIAKNLADQANTGVTILSGGTVTSELIKKLAKAPSVEVVAAPTVTTLSGQTAEIKLVQERYFPERWIPASDDGTTKGNAPAVPEFGDPRDIGITMSVTPNLGRDGKSVQLHLSYSIVEFKGFQEASEKQGSPEGAMPIFSERSIETRVTASPGETIVLSGMPVEEIKVDGISEVRSILVFVTASTFNADGTPVE